MTDKNNKRSSNNSVGYWLWEIRTKQGYSLEEVAEYIRIRPAMLRAIEQDAYENLPGGLYVAGYLKSYGRFLGLDADAVVQRFKEQQGVGEQENAYFQPQAAQEYPAFNGRLILAISAAVVLAIYIGWSLVTSDVRAPAPAPTAMPVELEKKLEADVDIDASKIVLPLGDNEGVVPQKSEPVTQPQKPEATKQTKNQQASEQTGSKTQIYKRSPSVKDLSSQVKPEPVSGSQTEPANEQ